MTEELNAKQEDQILEEAREVSYLDKVKQTKTEIEELLGKADTAIKELRDFKTEEILSGKSEAGKPAEKPAEETPEDYAKRQLRGG